VTQKHCFPDLADLQSEAGDPNNGFIGERGKRHRKNTARVGGQSSHRQERWSNQEISSPRRSTPARPALIRRFQTGSWSGLLPGVQNHFLQKMAVHPCQRSGHPPTRQQIALAQPKTLYRRASLIANMSSSCRPMRPLRHDSGEFRIVFQDEGEVAPLIRRKRRHNQVPA